MIWHVGMLFVLGVTFLITGLTWLRDRRRLRRHMRRFMIGTMVAQVVCMAGMAYVLWPTTSTGFAPAQSTAEAFLAHLSAGEPDSALALVQGGSAGDGQDQLENPASRPVSWRITEADTQSRQVIGEVTFPDGSSRSVSIAMAREWLRARWVVRGMVYESANGPTVVFWLDATAVDSVLESLPLAISVLVVIVSILRLVRLANDRRSLVKAGHLSP